MNLQQLYYFKKVAELEHYTKSAEELMISQPCLSYSIADLEKELNAPLFLKKGRNIKLTKYGHAFLIHVDKALGEIELGIETVNELMNPDSGTVILANVSAVNCEFIPQLVSRFYLKNENKAIKFEFHQDTMQKIIEGLKDESYDIGFGNKIGDNNLGYCTVYVEEMVAIVSNSHPFSSKKKISIKEIARENFITYESQCGSRFIIDDLFEKVNIKPNVVCEVINEVMVTSIVAANLGVSIVPKMYGAPYYNVKALDIYDVETDLTMYMMWRKDEYISPLAERFIKFVMKNVN